LDTGGDRSTALDTRGLDVGTEVTVVADACGRRMGICRTGDDCLVVSLSEITVAIGIVKLKRLETDGKRGTLEFIDGSSVALLKLY
jgi:hypothetical protein